MASKAASPTANILRHSRLFSLPPPLRRPDVALAANRDNSLHDSDTATLPHPVIQAIETTPEGHHRGDWGLKRSLPKKITQATSTPVFRIKEIDSIDHITDYESAADHWATAQKWREMNVPISLPSDDTHSLMSNKVSVFEENYHNTAKSTKGSDKATRWRFEGKPINKLSPLQFERYVNKAVKSRKAEFNQFAREALNKRRVLKAQQRALDKGGEVEEVQPLTDEEFQTEFLRLRQQPKELMPIIWQFLDLPGLAPDEAPLGVDTIFEASQNGVPATHLSAGLGYIRTGNIIPNHPELGPVKYHPPVHGRILRHGKSKRRNNGMHMVGVGGVVSKVENFPSFGASQTEPSKNQEIRFEHSLETGAKTWVRPKSASIDSKGRINLAANRAESDAMAVWEHQVDSNARKGGESLGALPYQTGMTLDFAKMYQKRQPKGNFSMR